jgi:hypothetical protein
MVVGSWSDLLGKIRRDICRQANDQLSLLLIELSTLHDMPSFIRSKPPDLSQSDIERFRQKPRVSPEDFTKSRFGVAGNIASDALQGPHRMKHRSRKV